ncbi:MAG: esterase-like activity of phytase family protein [Pseudomonadota bacterium]
MRRILACLSLIILLAPGTFLRTEPEPPNDSQEISLVPVALNPLKPAQRRIGALDYIAGWELRSRNSRFGGISSMLVEPGSRILALSDGGTLFSFALRQSSGFADSAAADADGGWSDFIAPLPGVDGEDRNKAYRDAESLVRDPETGRFWVGFEDSNRIVRYGAGLARAETGYRPEAMRGWPSNSGAEAMVLLGSARFLVFSEDQEYGPGVTEALLFIGDPADPEAQAIRFGYRPPIGYNITDATLLPDGRLIILNRRFTVLEGVSARITVADPADIARDAVLEGRLIAGIDPPLTVDNMEAIAITSEASSDDPDAGEDIMVWIASDDNFNTVQRSLLMKFRLDLERLDSGETFRPGLSSIE